ncbi:PAS domain S-box protein [Bacillus timonensis]|nr:PAS domain S-box protein [Bacillus timonensis]
MNQFFATVLSELEDFVLILRVDEDGKFRYFYANKIALEKGTVKEKDYGKSIDEVLPKDRVRELTKIYNESINQKKRMVISDEVVLQTGYVLGKATCTPIFTDKGVCSHLVIVARNITEEKRNEEKLDAANIMLDSFLNCTGDGILILDANRKTVRINKAYTDVSGYTEEDVIGKSPAEWIAPKHLAEFHRIINIVETGRELRDFQTQRIHKNGRKVDISVTYSPYKNRKGEIIGFICSFRDITERKRMEEKLQKSIDQYKLITENMSDIICVLNNTGEITYVSPSSDIILENPPEFFVGKCVFSMIHPEDREVLRESLRKVNDATKPGRYEFRFLHKNGDYIWIEIHSTPVLNHRKALDHIVIVARDISSRKRAEHALAESKEKYELIANNTSDLIKTYNLDGMISFASPSHKSVLGLDGKFLEKKSIYQFIHYEDVAHIKSKLKEVRANREPFLMQIRLQNNSGDWLTFESITTPILCKGTGEVVSFLSVSRNISDRLKNEELIRNLDRLSIIGQLAAGVAHEIRNPLTSLKGFSKILSSTLKSGDSKKYLGIMLDELDRIDLIVNEFMSLAKPQAVEFKQVNLCEIITSTMTVLETQAMLHNVQLICDFPEQDIFINCQPNQIKQVFMNFIKNSIEAMGDRGGVVQITIELTSIKHVRVTVKDEGAGIETSRLKYLGTPFYTTKEKGIGLGLTISNKIIKEHHGEMNIKSQLGVGTSVEVTLPIVIMQKA